MWLQRDLFEVALKARVFWYEYYSKLLYGGTKERFFDKANRLLEDLHIERLEVCPRFLIL